METFLDAFDPDDGSLPDCEAQGVSPDDWEAVFHAVRAKGWASTWMADDGDKPLPDDLSAVLGHHNAVVVWPSSTVRIHLYPANEAVLLDFDLKEITTQEALNALVDALRAVARSIHKSLTISYEGDSPAFVYVLDRDVLERAH